MISARPASLTRCVLFWMAATAVAGGLVGWAWTTLAVARRSLRVSGLATQPFDRDLVWLCAAVVLLGCAWLWLAMTLVTLEAVRGRTGSTPGVPDVVRRWVLSACGVAVAGGLAAGLCGPAGATPGRLHQDDLRRSPALVAGLPLPDRAADALPGGARMSVGPVRDDPRSGPERRPAPTVVVHPGDTLWDIARRALPPGAGDEQIAARWREIYEVNRAVVGRDPDLIRPAQRLRLPAEDA
jgi:hypothetical protein